VYIGFRLDKSVTLSDLEYEAQCSAIVSCPYVLSLLLLLFAFNFVRSCLFKIKVKRMFI